MTSDDYWAALADTIAHAETAGATVGVTAISPQQERFSHNGKRRFVAASTVKIPIMIELFRQVEAGEQSLMAEHVLRAEDKTTGSGVLGNLHDGLALTIGDLAYLMMSISDNAATNILIDRVGIDRVNDTMRGLGMLTSTLGRRMKGRHVVDQEQENWATSDDYATVMAALMLDRAAQPTSCAQMRALLEQQQNPRRIARHIPQVNGPRWGSKTGSLPGVVNDVGFIMTDDGPLILAVFCEGLESPHTGEQIVGDIAKAALDRALAS